jgi:hypothetical protein
MASASDPRTFARVQYVLGVLGGAFLILLGLLRGNAAATGLGGLLVVVCGTGATRAFTRTKRWVS